MKTAQSEYTYEAYALVYWDAERGRMACRIVGPEHQLAKELTDDPNRNLGVRVYPVAAYEVELPPRTK